MLYFKIICIIINNYLHHWPIVTDMFIVKHTGLTD